MKQVLQSLRTGKATVTDVPCPAVQRGHILIRTTRTLVSTGTEKMLVDFGRAGWLARAHRHPDKVRAVLDKARTDGLVATLEAVRDKLDRPQTLGYCNVGHVLAVGEGVRGFAVGDRVASNGPHAEIVSVSAQLCAHVPDGVDDESAAFTVLGGIALQGIRLIQPTLGETIAVSGLGVIGLLAVQLLRANGCRVIALDFDGSRLALASAFGAHTVDLTTNATPERTIAALTQGTGVDGVLVTASTRSSDPIHLAAQTCRKRGRIVLVGATGLELSRADFYEKELSFQVSCSYGPGRYDPGYEERREDYPIGFVRWTAQRNFEAVLELLSSGRVDTAPLVSHRIPIREAEQAYAVIDSDAPSLGVMFTYPEAQGSPDRGVSAPTLLFSRAVASTHGRVSIAMIGAGGHVTRTLIPAFKEAGAHLAVIASQNGVSGVHAAQNFGFASTTTDVDAIFEDAGADAVVIATRHDSHAALIVRALQAGKHVFVEKPLALSLEEVDAIEAELQRRVETGQPRCLMVGFNRRFAPLTGRLKTALGHGPRAMVCTVNAGSVAPLHWVHDHEMGGGRIIGEACHFIDLLRFLADAPLVRHAATAMASPTADTATIQLTFTNGSIGTIHYFANGHRKVAKERLEIYDAGRIASLDNFTRLQGSGFVPSLSRRTWRQDKGHSACVVAFIDAITRGAPPPIPPGELFEVSRASIALAAEVRRTAG
jgi:predicted dehydrogenase/threonine dehydrogenase-like Zn-dependent dehydrogenase